MNGLQKQCFIISRIYYTQSINIDKLVELKPKFYIFGAHIKTNTLMTRFTLSTLFYSIYATFKGITQL